MKSAVKKPTTVRFNPKDITTIPSINRPTLQSKNRDNLKTDKWNKNLGHYLMISCVVFSVIVIASAIAIPIKFLVIDKANKESPTMVAKNTSFTTTTPIINNGTSTTTTTPIMNNTTATSVTSTTTTTPIMNNTTTTSVTRTTTTTPIMNNTTATSVTSTTTTTPTINNTTTTTTSSVINNTTRTTTALALPAQCSSYTINTDSTRNVGYSIYVGCDSGVFGGGTWVRFMSPAGTMMPTYVVPENFCGTSAVGWYNGAYPSTAGLSTSGTVCFNWAGVSCMWSSAITITHCSTFYVFYLPDAPVCSLRYCTI